MGTNKILAEVNETFTTLLELINFFDHEQLNTVPFEDSWTAGQLVMHVAISGSGFVQVLHGPVKDTDRVADKLEDKIKTDFLNFTIKMKSPDFVVPPQKEYNADELSATIRDIWSGIKTATETMDLTKTCVAFELPVYGNLTRFEAICFVNYHTQRHVHQLRKIKEVISGGTAIFA